MDAISAPALWQKTFRFGNAHFLSRWLPPRDNFRNAEKILTSSNLLYKLISNRVEKWNCCLIASRGWFGGVWSSVMSFLLSFHDFSFKIYDEERKLTVNLVTKPLDSSSSSLTFYFVGAFTGIAKPQCNFYASWCWQLVSLPGQTDTSITGRHSHTPAKCLEPTGRLMSAGQTQFLHGATTKPLI